MDDKNAKVPDAEVVSEEKNIPATPPVEKVTVILPKEQAPVVVRVESRSRHRLNVECYEIDDEGYIDIVISDADMN
jgi:exosome complex RNA-binding protein Csl4